MRKRVVHLEIRGRLVGVDVATVSQRCLWRCTLERWYRTSDNPGRRVTELLRLVPSSSEHEESRSIGNNLQIVKALNYIKWGSKLLWQIHLRSCSNVNDYNYKHQGNWLSRFRRWRSIWVPPCYAVGRLNSRRVGVAGRFLAGGLAWPASHGPAKPALPISAGEASYKYSNKWNLLIMSLQGIPPHWSTFVGTRTIHMCLVEPYINYCNLVWAQPDPAVCSDRIFRIQKKYCRIITFSNFRAHSELIFKKLSILNVYQMYKYQIALLMYVMYKKMESYTMTGSFSFVTIMIQFIAITPKGAGTYTSSVAEQENANSVNVLWKKNEIFSY